MSMPPQGRTGSGLSATDLLCWLCCPQCKGNIKLRAEAYFCAHCARSFPIVMGIPDLRVYPDPYVTFEEDHFKGRQVHEQVKKLSFPELLQFYWENVSKPPTPVELRNRFIRHVLTDEERVRRFPVAGVHGAACVDVGCGAGAMQDVANGQFNVVFSADIAFRWLVLARKRLEEAGLPANVICCCADYLPFRGESFDLVTGISLLEHTANAETVVAECGRVVKRQGIVFLLTTNRFSLAPEPHVRIWGLGFLPRKWMPAVVKWRRGLAYDKHRLLSLFELRRFLRSARLERMQFSLPAITPADLEHRSGLERAGAGLFDWMGRISVLRWLLLAVAPILQVVARRD